MGVGPTNSTASGQSPGVGTQSHHKAEPRATPSATPADQKAKAAAIAHPPTSHLTSAPHPTEASPTASSKTDESKHDSLVDKLGIRGSVEDVKRFYSEPLDQHLQRVVRDTFPDGDFSTPEKIVSNVAKGASILLGGLGMGAGKAAGEIGSLATKVAFQGVKHGAEEVANTAVNFGKADSQNTALLFGNTRPTTNNAGIGQWFKNAFGGGSSKNGQADPKGQQSTNTLGGAIGKEQSEIAKTFGIQPELIKSLPRFDNPDLFFKGDPREFIAKLPDKTTTPHGYTKDPKNESAYNGFQTFTTSYISEDVTKPGRNLLAWRSASVENPNTGLSHSLKVDKFLADTIYETNMTHRYQSGTELKVPASIGGHIKNSEFVESVNKAAPQLGRHFKNLKALTETFHGLGFQPTKNGPLVSHSQADDAMLYRAEKVLHEGAGDRGWRATAAFKLKQTKDGGWDLQPSSSIRVEPWFGPGFSGDQYRFTVERDNGGFLTHLHQSMRVPEKYQKGSPVDPGAMPFDTTGLT